MKPLLLAFLSTVSILVVQSPAFSQAMSPSLNCDPEEANPKLDGDDSVFGDDGVSSGGTGTGETGIGTGSVGSEGADGKGSATGSGTGSGTASGTGSGGTGAGAGTGMIGGSGGVTGGPGGTVSGGPGSVTNPGTGSGNGTGTGAGSGTGAGAVETSAPAKNPPYVTNGSVASMTVTSKNGVAYYRVKADPKNQQNLPQVKSYPAPNGGGVTKVIGGQKILAKNADVKTAGLSAGIVNIIDEINLTAAALGLPDPVITAGFDKGGHSPNSKHYTGNALDLRCNSTYASGNSCKKWVIAMQNAFGPGYDVTWEDHGDGNSHIHLSYGR